MNDREYALLSKQNKLLSVMIIMNILFVLMIFYLLVRDKDEPLQTNSSEPAVTRQEDEKTGTNPVTVNPVVDAAHISETVTANVKKGAASNASKAIPEFVDTVMAATDTKPDNDASAKNLEQEPVNTVTVSYDGKLVRMEETDSEGNQLITISKSLDDIGELSSDDASYVKALEELKQGARSQIIMSKATAKEAATYEVKEVSEERSVDYFNKVDVSKNTTQQNDEEPSLAAQIAQIVSEPESTTATEEIISEKQEDSYIQTLKAESIERANEMRTVKIIKGDTLWVLAERAYGSGYEYPRIFEANPHLIDPDRLEIGDLLRVPL